MKLLSIAIPCYNSAAYMEFYDDGNIKTYDAAGNLISEGQY